MGAGSCNHMCRNQNSFGSGNDRSCVYELCAELCQSLACRFDIVCTLSPGNKGESNDEENGRDCEAG